MTFDALATNYDATFGLSPTGRLFRFRLAERVMALAPPPGRVLDLGCGTGEDALWLEQNGYTVHGVDSSLRMIEVAKSKRTQSGLKTTFECRPLESLTESGETFDVVISNFGALNCVSSDLWTRLIPRLLAPSGRAFLVLMGRKPLPESFRRGFASTDRGATAPVTVGPRSLVVRYDSAEELKERLGKGARVDHVEAMGCVVPGPGYVGFARRHPLVLGVLAMGECVLRAAPFFRDRGDHTLIEFRGR